MFIDNAALAERLGDPNNLIRRRETDASTRRLARVKLPEHPEDSCAIAPLHNGGRRKGDTNLDSETRAQIGAAAQVETLEKVATDNNISIHHAHELANGMHSTAQGVNPELVENINKKLEQPHDIALDKLTKTLLAIDDTAISRMKPKELASMASQLSRVAENTAPLKHEDEDAKETCKLIVYAPVIKQENHYKSIEVERAIKS